jgi:hypothetical protein
VTLFLMAATTVMAISVVLMSAVLFLEIERRLLMSNSAMRGCLRHRGGDASLFVDGDRSVLRVQRASSNADDRQIDLPAKFNGRLGPSRQEPPLALPTSSLTFPSWLGYLFLLNLFVRIVHADDAIIQADDVYAIFFDVLALELVQKLDDVAQ